MGPRNKSPHLSVIISVINKSATIQEIIKRVINSPEVYEIVIVNDGSTDGTSYIL